MKEIEKTQIKLLSDRLDLIRHQMASMQLTNETEKYTALEKERAALEIQIAHLKAVRHKKLSKEAQKLVDMPFKRPITKKEQADLGKLKKAVRGLVIVHPMTALGREMELEDMTGFSKTEF
ncbi:YibL family ribosome-associated protein [Providencia sp. Me31A]|uniref:YibL family ribosome-associated protein n=1 Tax=Providencia sp. Me31A TaxID=3392637 RepID=UPI003D299A3D